MTPKDAAYLQNENILNRLFFFNQDIYVPTRTIYVGYDSGEGGSFITAETTAYVAKSLHILENENPEEPVTIILNTSGGEDYHGWGIYDAIRSFPAKVTMKVLGHCMSMGTIILQAADERLAYPNASFLIHMGSTSFAGDADKIQSEAKETERLTERMIAVYMAATGLSKSKVKTICAKESYFDAKEALKLGIIDDIIPLP